MFTDVYFFSSEKFARYLPFVWRVGIAEFMISIFAYMSIDVCSDYENFVFWECVGQGMIARCRR